MSKVKISLGKLGEIITGNTPKTSEQENYASNDICFVKPSDISDSCITFLEDSEFYISEIARNKARIIPENSILVTCIGIIGKVAINNVPCAFNQQINAIIPDANRCITKYLAYAIEYQKEKIQMIANAAVVPILNKTQFSNIEIDIDTISEQRKIVERLDKVTDLIALRKQQLTKLDELIKARFVELFGNVSDFVNITDIAHIYIGLVTTMTKHYCNNGTPLLFNSSIKSDKIVWDGTYLDVEFAEANKSRMHKTNDIVTVHTGDIGTSAVIGEEFNNSLGFATIVTRINDTSRYYPRFVSSFLNYGSGKEQLKKYSRDVRNNLNLKDFNRLMVPNASVLEQKRYVDFLEQTDKSKLAIQKSLNELETLKKALMQEYFG